MGRVPRGSFQVTQAPARSKFVAVTLGAAGAARRLFNVRDIDIVTLVKVAAFVIVNDLHPHHVGA